MKKISNEAGLIQDFIDKMSDAVLLLTPEENILTYNQKLKSWMVNKEVSVGEPVNTLLLQNESQMEGTLLTAEGPVGVQIKESELPLGGEMYPCLFLTKQEEVLPADQESLLKTIMDIVPDFIGIKDGNGRFVFANKFVEDLFELSGFSLVGKTDHDLAKIKPFFQEVFQYCIETDEQVWQAGKIVRCEEFVPTRDGGTRYFDVYKIPVFNPDGSRKNLLVFGREVTEKMESRVLLEQSEARYRLLAEHSMDMISTRNGQGLFTYVSPASRILLGREPEEFIGLECFGGLHPDDEEVTRNEYDRLMSGPRTSTVQFRLLNKEGQYVWFETSCKSIVDEDGNVIEIIGVTRDISERKKAEEILRQSDKLSIVGQLAASVAHEIRNPLTSLKGFVQFLQESETIDPSNYYKIMHHELTRIDEIMGQLLLLAKPQVKRYKKTSLADLIDFVLSLLQPEALVQNVMVETAIEENLPLITAEENELKQVLINVIKNAMDSMHHGGKIQLKATLKGDWIELTVKDEGCGIAAERLQKLGEPFYTTKEKGTGLGLMVSMKIIKEHKGTLTFHSIEGEGTTVTIILPIQ